MGNIIRIGTASYISYQKGLCSLFLLTRQPSCQAHAPCLNTLSSLFLRHLPYTLCVLGLLTSSLVLTPGP